MKLMVRIPTNDHPDRSLTEWLMWASRKYNQWDIAIHYGTAGPDETRNEIVALFLQSEATHLWMIDDDVVPPRSNTLIKQEFPVVSGVYPGYHAGLGSFYHVYRRVEDTWRIYGPTEWPEHEVFEAGAVGAGCLLIERGVLEGMDPPWFHFTYEEGRRIGEDITFCHKAGGVHVVKSYLCEHMRDVPLTHVAGLTRWAGIGYGLYQQAQKEGA